MAARDTLAATAAGYVFADLPKSVQAFLLHTIGRIDSLPFRLLSILYASYGGEAESEPQRIYVSLARHTAVSATKVSAVANLYHVWCRLKHHDVLNYHLLDSFGSDMQSVCTWFRERIASEHPAQLACRELSLLVSDLWPVLIQPVLLGVPEEQLRPPSVDRRKHSVISDAERIQT